MHDEAGTQFFGEIFFARLFPLLHEWLRISLVSTIVVLTRKVWPNITAYVSAKVCCICNGPIPDDAILD